MQKKGLKSLQEYSADDIFRCRFSWHFKGYQDYIMYIALLLNDILRKQGTKCSFHANKINIGIPGKTKITEYNPHLTPTNSKRPRKAPASVAQLDAPSDRRPGGRGFNPRRGRQHSFLEIDYEIFSTVILSLQLIQEGQLSVSGERMCTILVNRLED